MNTNINRETQKKNIILCFCKQPTPGLVKSRLAKDLGDEAAAKVYMLLLNETIKIISKLNLKIFLYCYPNINHPTLSQYTSEFHLTLKKQHGDDLGMKMHHAIEKHLCTNNNVVLIGTDCLEIDANYISKAFEDLNAGYDIVLGPATDGGYALIGANKIDLSIFQNINWGTNQVLKQTEEKIKNLNWRYSCLTKVRDLDNLDDYKYFSTHERYRTLF